MVGTPSTVGRVLERPATATLTNGDEVTINDYVYFAPPWSERDGSPYSIARIIEFLPPTAAKYNHLAHKGPSKERHVRLALFYRPSEISGRLATDHRLLLAAIHSEVHPVSWLRGKCWVRHREKIENLHDWKKKPDHFHYSRLFDPYIKREYEMIRTVTVTNVPDYVRRVLAKRYEFLVTEKEMVADLTDTFRTCRTCLEWAASQESVKCEVCKAWYHMECVSPPLPAKPSRGYSWMCSQCMHDRVTRNGDKKKLDSIESAPMTQLALARTFRGKAKEKEKVVPIDYDKPDVFFRGWNFRYFGQYTVAEHSVDSDDPIFPRQVTRLGQRFQGVIPTWEEQKQLEHERGNAPYQYDSKRFWEDGRSKLSLKPYRMTSVPERGEEETVTVLSLPSCNPTKAIAAMRQLRLPVQSNSVDAYDTTLELATHMSVSAVTAKLKSLKAEDFSKRYVRDLNPRELAIFETELLRWGSLEAHETAKRVGRQPWEMVRYYYKWRNEKLAAENLAIREEIQNAKTERQRQRLTLSHLLHEPADVPAKAKREANAKGKGKAPRYIPKGHKAVTGVQSGAASVLGHQREATPESDAEGSVWEDDELKEAKPACSACGVKKDGKWWKAPRSQQGQYLCNHCGSSYRKYGVSLPYRAHLERTTGEKRSSTPMDEPSGKRQKVIANAIGSKASTPPPPLPAPAKLAPCAYCYKMEPKPMARCRNCTFAVHPGCYGLPRDDVTDTWLCDPCANEKTLEAALDIRCVLCPAELPTTARRPIPYRPRVMPEFDYMHAIKPTEGYKWAHVLCSTFVGDLQWSDGQNLRVTEGIMSLKAIQFGRCDICGKEGSGAVIHCGDCPRRFHTTCAWISGYRFAFESRASVGPRASKRDRAEGAMSTFKGVTGVLTPHCWCLDHSMPKDKRIFEITDVDPATNLSTLQAYAASVGQVPKDNSFGLLRKAKRLEDQLATRADHTQGASDGTECSVCATHFSPKWYTKTETAPTDLIPLASSTTTSSSSSSTRLCHQCWFSTNALPAPATTSSALEAQ